MNTDKTITYLTNPEARYVSLVKRGANRTPFRIVKGEDKAMKIIQKIVAKKGVEIEAIKNAVGEEAASALNFDTPKEAGVFTIYEQHPESAFKSDNMEVVALTDDKSLLAICGEFAEKSEGFNIAKLLTRKSQVKAVEVPENLASLDVQVLKEEISGVIWNEFEALGQAIAGVLSQTTGEKGCKKKIIKTLCDNFLEAVDTATGILKSEEFAPRKEEKLEENVPAVEKSAEEKNTHEQTREIQEAQSALVETAEKADEVNKEEDKNVGNVLPTVRVEEIVEKAVKEIADAMTSAMDKLQEQLNAVEESVRKMEKTPATPVTSHEDNGPKVNSQKSENVFAGCFGDLRR